MTIITHQGPSSTHTIIPNLMPSTPTEGVIPLDNNRKRWEQKESLDLFKEQMKRVKASKNTTGCQNDVAKKCGQKVEDLQSRIQQPQPAIKTKQQVTETKQQAINKKQKEIEAKEKDIKTKQEAIEIAKTDIEKNQEAIRRCTTQKGKTKRQNEKKSMYAHLGNLYGQLFELQDQLFELEVQLFELQGLLGRLLPTGVWVVKNKMPIILLRAIAITAVAYLFKRAFIGQSCSSHLTFARTRDLKFRDYQEIDRQPGNNLPFGSMKDGYDVKPFERMGEKDFSFTKEQRDNSYLEYLTTTVSEIWEKVPSFNSTTEYLSTGASAVWEGVKNFNCTQVHGGNNHFLPTGACEVWEKLPSFNSTTEYLSTGASAVWEGVKNFNCTQVHGGNNHFLPTGACEVWEKLPSFNSTTEYLAPTFSNGVGVVKSVLTFPRKRDLKFRDYQKIDRQPGNNLPFGSMKDGYDVKP